MCYWCNITMGGLTKLGKKGPQDGHGRHGLIKKLLFLSQFFKNLDLWS